MLSILAIAACLSGPSIKGDASPKDLVAAVVGAGDGVPGTFNEEVPTGAGAGAAGVCTEAVAGAGVDGGGFAAAGAGLGFKNWSAPSYLCASKRKHTF